MIGRFAALSMGEGVVAEACKVDAREHRPIVGGCCGQAWLCRRLALQPQLQEALWTIPRRGPRRILPGQSLVIGQRPVGIRGFGHRASGDHACVVDPPRPAANHRHRRDPADRPADAGVAPVRSPLRHVRSGASSRPGCTPLRYRHPRCRRCAPCAPRRISS